MTAPTVLAAAAVPATWWPGAAGQDRADNAPGGAAFPRSRGNGGRPLSLERA